MARMTKEKLAAKKAANMQKEFLFNTKEDMVFGFQPKKLPAPKNMAKNNYKQTKSGHFYKSKW